MRLEMFNSDWCFHFGEVEGAETLEFDDRNWRPVELPFDFLIEQSLDSRNSPYHGFLPGGIGWFRKSFQAQEITKERIFIDFEGIYQLSRVWCNGVLLGFRPSGFAGFEYELTACLRPGKNIIAVRAEVPAPSCRWYPGGGICRDVRIFSTGSSRFARHGISVTTSRSTTKSAEVEVAAEIEGTAASVSFELVAPTGEPVAERIVPVENFKAAAAFTVSEPRLWSVGSPELYTMRARLMDSEEREVRFGVRSIEFTRDDGFHLNHQRVQIQGVCLHENFGCLGAANFHSALARQLEILKEMGCNAIRTAHNPPSPVLLDLCDKRGFLVMDEVFDEWHLAKGADGYRQVLDPASVESLISYWNIPEVYHGYSKYFSEWHERDLTEFIRRDRNHPSVILWSIGNEILEQGTPDGGKTAHLLADAIRKIDSTRPVTAGVSNTPGALANGMGDALDVFGINYTPQYYHQVHERYPVVGSETVASEYCRGEYLFNTSERDWRFAEVKISEPLDCDGNNYISPDLARSVPPRDGFQIHRDTAFMTNIAGTPVELALRTQEKCPFSAGEFIWSGFDYLGEPFCAIDGLGWPLRSSHSGLVDTAGFPKDVYYLYQSRWSSRSMAYLMPHWTWPDARGHRIPVRCFTNGDEAELFLNGQSQGICLFSDTGRLFLEWMVEYEPGILRVVTRRNGCAWAEHTVETAGEPAGLELIPDRNIFGAPGNELCFVTIRVVDAAGRVTPEANFPIRLSVSGAGTLAGVDNGESICHDAYTGNTIHAYHGLALAVLRATPGAAGVMRLHAKGQGFEEEITVKVETQQEIRR